MWDAFWQSYGISGAQGRVYEASDHSTCLGHVYGSREQLRNGRKMAERVSHIDLTYLNETPSDSAEK